MQKKILIIILSLATLSSCNSVSKTTKTIGSSNISNSVTKIKTNINANLPDFVNKEVLEIVEGDYRFEVEKSENNAAMHLYIVSSKEIDTTKPIKLKFNKSIESEYTIDKPTDESSIGEQDTSQKVNIYTAGVYNKIDLNNELIKAKEINKLSSSNKEEYKKKSIELMDEVSKKLESANNISDAWTNKVNLYHVRIPLKYSFFKTEKILDVEMVIDGKKISKKFDDIKFVESKSLPINQDMFTQTQVIEELNINGMNDSLINTIQNINNEIKITKDCIFTGISFLQNGFKAVELEGEYYDASNKLIWKREYKENERWDLKKGNKLKISYKLKNEDFKNIPLLNTYITNFIKLNIENKDSYVPFEVNLVSKDTAKDLLIRSRYKLNIGNLVKDLKQIESLLWSENNEEN